MSWAKRLIDIKCQMIANETGYSWDEIMEAAASVDFDMELIDRLVHSNNLYLLIGGERNVGNNQQCNLDDRG